MKPKRPVIYGQRVATEMEKKMLPAIRNSDFIIDEAGVGKVGAITQLHRSGQLT